MCFVGYTPIRCITTTQPAMYSTSNDRESNSDEPIQIENPFIKSKRQCILCSMKITPNYKNVRLLSQFQSAFTGRIYGSHITGLCRNKQAQVEKEIEKAQQAALMPSYIKSPEFLKCPRLFNPDKPIRASKY